MMRTSRNIRASRVQMAGQAVPMSEADAAKKLILPLYGQARPGTNDFHGSCVHSFFRSSLTSNAKSTQPIIISSQVWSPQVTARSGSGLLGFSAELSK